MLFFINLFFLNMSETLSLVNQNKHLVGSKTSRIGDLGENLALRFLQKKGYRIVLSNFKIPIGRNRRGVAVTGEIDIIAFEKDVLCFIEVKTRTSEKFSSALSAIDLRKQRQITRTARVYRRTFGLNKNKFRYDAVTVVLKEKKPPKIELFRNFWNESKFRKKVWMDEF